MSTAWQPDTAAALVGLAVFQLLALYKDTAPSLAALRDGGPGDPTHQQLTDADYTVGSIAIIVSLGMAWLTKDWTALLLITFAFGSYVIWYHGILNRSAT